jgi:hypothetical protein
MERQCKSSWIGVHEIFQPEEYDASALPSKTTMHMWRQTEDISAMTEFQIEN